MISGSCAYGRSLRPAGRAHERARARLRAGMSGMARSGHGGHSTGFHDRIFPTGPESEQIAEWLARLVAASETDGHAALELGVGVGRVALPLSRRIGDVVGVDSSPERLSVLRESLSVTPRPVVPVEGDMRTYADGRQYRLVYCLRDTFCMLLDPADQRQVLLRCAEALAPGGTVVLETHNPAAVAALHQGRPREIFFTPYPGEDTGLLSYSTRDPEKRTWRLSHIWFEEGNARISSTVSRLTEPEELDAHAGHAGLSLHGRYGDWHGTPYTGSEPMVVSVYRAGKTGDA
ncbi:class I SAM-dependent methyltransferase [Sphaerisporangium fuscum]|uniref:class I SAM-dependent methyltransferase n=1 Tax=Sphaerisporangium fuscum TaxID=2835868 RepID=UPI001BDC4E11|nr:class I SAM-dependent methyltransferase [Sphaerisporangium fuscum]